MFLITVDLTNNNELSKAYQHCLNGSQWVSGMTCCTLVLSKYLQMNTFQYDRACEEYEIGLAAMLKAAKSKDP